MKTLVKPNSVKFSKPKFTQVDSFPFLKGVEMFEEKTKRAKELFKNVKLPKR